MHRTGDVLIKMPKHKQASAKSELQDIWMAEAVKALDFSKLLGK